MAGRARLAASREAEGRAARAAQPRSLAIGVRRLVRQEHRAPRVLTMREADQVPELMHRLDLRAARETLGVGGHPVGSVGKSREGDDRRARVAIRLAEHEGRVRDEDVHLGDPEDGRRGGIPAQLAQAPQDRSRVVLVAVLVERIFGLLLRWTDIHPPPLYLRERAPYVAQERPWHRPERHHEEARWHRERLHLGPLVRRTEALLLG